MCACMQPRRHDKICCQSKLKTERQLPWIKKQPAMSPRLYTIDSSCTYSDTFYHFIQDIQRIQRLVRWVTCAVWFGDYRPIHSIYGIINGCMRGTTSILATATVHLSHKFIACSVNTFFHLVVSCCTVHNLNKALWAVVYNSSKR